MKNAIHSVEAKTVRLDPGEAEVRITVQPEFLDAQTELRGKLVGPRCHYASTVEVAYLAKPARTPNGNSMTLRVTIPEPSFWEPETPFLYQGSVELWQNDERNGDFEFQYGLRQVQLGPRGLIVNGHRFLIRAIEAAASSHESQLSAHRPGANTMIMMHSTRAPELLEYADRLGFFVFLRLSEADCNSDVFSEYAKHPCYLGQILAPGVSTDNTNSSGLIGAEIHEPSDLASARAHFVVVDQDLVSIAMPKLLRIACMPENNSCATSVLGWAKVEST
jgi:hypothetical protein